MSAAEAPTEAPALWIVEQDDNVATCIREGGLAAGRQYPTSIGGHDGPDVPVTADVPYGHKVALRYIARGEKILKYAMSLGIASEDIAAGDHVHVHNIESERGRGDVSESRSGLVIHEGPWAKWRNGAKQR